MKKYRSLQYFILAFISSFTFSGCSTSNIVVKPNPTLKKYDKKILSGKIKYSKFNKEYLPRLIQNDRTSSTTLKYDYTVAYNNGGVESDVVHLFNPLTIFGVPLSETGIMVSAKLEIMRGGKKTDTFEAHCAAKKTRNVFDVGATSEDRKTCLLKVRDSIDTQIFDKYNKEKK